MKAGDHLFELGQNPMRLMGVARVGCKKADGVVTPIIAQTFAVQQIVGDEGVHRQQLDRSDAKILDVVDHGRRTQPGIRPAQLPRNAGMKLRKSPDVCFVDDRSFPRDDPAASRSPCHVEVLVDDDALGNERRAVALVEREIFVWRSQRVAETRRVPGRAPDVGARVGIEQEFIGVETVTVCGLIRAVNAITVNGARSDVFEIAVVDLIGVFGQHDAFDFVAAGRIEQA